MNDTACLLIHGFAGTPFEMRPLADTLEAAGARVSTPALPGHAASVERWAATRWADWQGCVEDEYLRLAADHERVFALGLSMGGSLCLDLARRHRLAGVVTVASPVYLYRFLPPSSSDWRIPFTGLLRRLRPIWPTTPGRPESRAIAPWRGYEGVVALEPLYSLIHGLRELRCNLGQITAPLLAMHAPGDKQVPAGNLWEIVRGVRSPLRRAVLLEIEERVTSHHMLTTHREAGPVVNRLCARFVSAGG
ncbi:alpha/beta hydrolase [Fundidesulfovibrio soli]|uniref:alpha/beta hydrolase n=1 Tax=Fundidesulfovibrio soli TaxID=2922716 RepID=UPI001FAE8E14|nr:alpha/beta fold hydrolase [Fundidesulfovibrio soli]